MDRCLVIGGGLAGISAAVYLSESGHHINLIEASPKLGGRTYSLLDKKTNSEIDNGQHIFIGAYHNTFEFLKIIGTDDIPEYQSNLNVTFLKRGSNKLYLKARHSFYPINLVQSLFSYDALNLKEKISILKILGKIFFKKKLKDINNKSVLTWLNEENQTQKSINTFWEIISVGTMNTKLSEASAEVFYSLLSKMFFTGNSSATIVLPKLPLNKLFIEPAQKYFNEHNIKFSCSEKLISINSSGDRVIEIVTNKRMITEFDHIILAIPPYSISHIKSAEQILPPEVLSMETSPIITVHIWQKEKFIDEKFVGLIDSKIHWVFNNKDHISLVISAADELANKDSTAIFKIICAELIGYFPNFKEEEILHYKVIKEKRATLICSNKNEKLRKSINSAFSNAYFAGDWTNNKLPGTIEGAILSGKQAASEINC